jgi:very-short-patch-repair endonuclease
VSLVVGPDESGQLGRIGAMTGKPAERRMNVAASRAADQLWIVHSIEPEDFPAGDPRAELIRHCREPAQLEEMSDRLLDKCESEFERRVVRDILARGYRQVRVQKVVGNYRIDIVVEGPGGRRLAVECDGDAWHGIDRWDQDRARQTVLERARWTFERISGSTYFRDPARALEPLWARLDELGIPTGDLGEAGEPPPPRRVVEQVPVLGTEFGIDEAEAGADVESEVVAAIHEPDIAVVENTEYESGGGFDERLWNIEPQGEPRAAGGAETTLPAALAVTPPRFAFTPQHVSPQLRPYVQWQPVSLPLATEAGSERLVAALIDVVGAEGPIVARRAYLLCHQAADGHRIGKDIRLAFNRATQIAVRSRRLSQIRDSMPDQTDKTLYLPTSPPVVSRVLGPRDLYEVPRSEILALIQELSLDGAPAEDACRAVLDVYGLRKLTQKRQRSSRSAAITGTNRTSSQPALTALVIWPRTFPSLRI